MVPNSQLYSAAQSRDQAGIIFSLAAKMVRAMIEEYGGAIQFVRPSWNRVSARFWRRRGRSRKCR